MGGEQSTGETDRWFDWKPAENYDGYFAFIHNGNYSKMHVVDTTTFDNSDKIPDSYYGYTANIGDAESLCGRELTGRMVPLEQENQHINNICGSCLRSLSQDGY
jgi:hypothetical protein